jgi:hypothetical protein
VWLIEAQGTGATVDTDVPLSASAGTGDQVDAAWQVVAPQFPESAAPASSPAQTAASITPPTSSANPQPPGVSLSNGSETAVPGADTPSSAAPVVGAGAPARETTALAVQVDGAAAARHFSYVDRLTPAMRTYDLPAAPFASISAEVYPLASNHSPVLRGLGVVGGYGRAVGLGSTGSNGARVGTSWQSYDVALRERLSLGSHAMLAVEVGYGANDFEFDQPSFSASLPTVDYSFVRAGLQARFFFLGNFSVLVGGGYLNVLRAGDIQALFPRESVGGMDAFLGLAFLPMAHLELSARGAYSRFFYAFNPQPGDANVAGGALDEMEWFSLGVAYLL